MSEYRLMQTDIPWAKHFDEVTPMPLAEGTSAIIPNPEGNGYLHLPYETYAKVMSGLTRSAGIVPLGVSQLKKGYANQPPGDSLRKHTHGDGVIIPKEPTTDTIDRGER